jgi:hypothetical protein
VTLANAALAEEAPTSPVSAYPLAFDIISDRWILFAVIWLVAAFWTKRRGNRHGARIARISTSKIRRAWNPADHL